jgi:hypothetical protein
MLDLILIACFASFWLAVLDQIFEIIENYINLRLIKALTALGLSSGGAWLLGIESIRVFVIYTVAGAFVSALLVAIGSRISTYQPAIVRAVKPDRE